MNKLFVASPILLVLCMNLFGQDVTKEFEIKIPEYKISNSLYNSIKFIDSRIDTSNMGIVQVGLMNNKAKVISKSPILAQLGNVISALTDSTSENGELLFQLRHFKFAELTGALSEKGYCYLKAVLYSKKLDKYQKLAEIDTIVLIKMMDVTNPLLRRGSKLITDFIASNLLKDVNDSVHYGFQDVVKTDSIEKRKIKVYNIDKYTDGLYYNYNSFKDQIPDKDIIVETKKDKSISKVKILDENNKLIKVKPIEVFSIVYKGKLYIATEYGYYPLYKSADNFFFIGKVKASANSQEIMAASFFFGIIGGLIAASNANATYFIIIDHNNGGFIYYKEMKGYPEYPMSN